MCYLLREDPDLADAVPAQARPRAVVDCVAPTQSLSRGAWAAQGAREAIGSGIGLFVLNGLLLRRVGVDGRYGAELLGEGDLLRPWQGEDAAPTLARTTGWRVLQPTRLALLDEEATHSLAGYPELIGRFVARALERSRNLSVNMAIIHQARVNIRLHMLFWHLADRWGRVGSEGVILPLHLTHSVLADLVAARRPTVTTSLNELTRQELISPRPNGWLLFGEPPGELLALQEVEVSAAAPCDEP
jgi:CRP/FNR family transcriptional regulator, cyclic AMP receptor protein